MIVNYTEYVHPDSCDDPNCLYKDILPTLPHYHYYAAFLNGGIMTAAIRGAVDVVQLEIFNATRQDSD